MIEKEHIINEYYFQVEIEQGAYIWSHYQSDKRNFDYDIQLNDIVEEQGRVIGVRYGGTLFSLDEIGVGKIISESKESGGQERYRVERAVLRKKKKKMNFKDLTAEEALKRGVITRGKWNDEENWEMAETLWRKALTVADHYHAMAKSMYTDKSKEIRTGIREPYIKFIQSVIKILIEEAHIQDEMILTVAAFHDITVCTTYSRPVMEAEFGADIAEMVQTLRRNENEKIREYIGRCAKQEHACSLVCIIFAVLLQEERVSDICPFESWEEDIPYYKDLAEQIEPYISIFMEKGWDRAVFLW